MCVCLSIKMKITGNCYLTWLAASFWSRDFWVHLCSVFACVTFGGMSVGRASASIPDQTKAKLAAFKIKELLNRKSEIDPCSNNGLKPVNHYI